MSGKDQGIKIKAQLHCAVLKWKQALRSSRNESEVTSALGAINSLLSSAKSVSITEGQQRSLKDAFPGERTDTEWRRFQEEFAKSQYISLGQCIIEQLSLDWFSKSGHSGRDGRSFLEEFFLVGPPHDAVMLLCSSVYESSPSFKRNQCLSYLERLLQSGRIADLFWDQCRDQDRIYSVRITATWDKLINLLASLPDKMANTLKTENWDVFLPQQYFKTIAQDLLRTLHRVHQHISDSKDCSLVFVSHLLGKVCLCGHSATIFDLLLPPLLKLSSEDFIWSRICVRLLAGGPERSLEVILDCILRKVPWYGHMSRLLGDTVLNNQKVKFLLTNKFLLLRYSGNDLVLQNLIGYLADSPSRATLVPTVLSMILEAWSDGSALKHTSYEQHLYITKAILICTAHLRQKAIDEHKDALLHIVMRGMQAHLNTPIARLRTLGMVVGESLSKKLTPEVAALSFEYQSDDTSASLLALLTVPEDPGLDSIIGNLKELELGSSQGDTTDNDGDGGKPLRDVSSPAEEELDSDDDLEPCDMSGDTKVTKVKEPVYIRDCMEGLLARDNPDLVEASLRVAEKLIRKKPDNLSEVAVEFSKILLHLEDSYHTEKFTDLKMSGLRALTVLCPVKVATYMTEQFYDRNYNIRQRIDMLEVLSGAAQELSSPGASRDVSPDPTADQLIPINQIPGTENWREIVQKRIDSKTRRFASASKGSPDSSANRFAPVAGHFFFPLMKTYDSPMNTMNLLGGDFFLLGRLVHTLAMVLHAAQNTMICRQMAKSLLEFIWVIRYHTEPYVRQVVMFAVAMVIISVPPHTVTTDLQGDLIECQMWLEDIVERDPEPECKKQAAETILLLQQTINKELKDGEG